MPGRRAARVAAIALWCACASPWMAACRQEPHDAILDLHGRASPVSASMRRAVATPANDNRTHGEPADDRPKSDYPPNSRRATNNRADDDRVSDERANGAPANARDRPMNDDPPNGYGATDNRADDDRANDDRANGAPANARDRPMNDDPPNGHGATDNRADDDRASDDRANGEPDVSRAIEASAFVVVDLRTGRTAREQRGERLDTPVWPGSIAKLATFAAALDAGTLTDATRIVCTRRVTLVGGRRVDCSHPPLGRGLSAAEALAHSCNVFAATIARTLTRPQLSQGFVAMGLPPPPAAADPIASALGLDGAKVAPRRLIDTVLRTLPTREGIAGRIVPDRARQTDRLRAHHANAESRRLAVASGGVTKRQPATGTATTGTATTGTAATGIAATGIAATGIATRGFATIDTPTTSTPTTSTSTTSTSTTGMPTTSTPPAGTPPAGAPTAGTVTTGTPTTGDATLGAATTGDASVGVTTAAAASTGARAGADPTRRRRVLFDGLRESARIGTASAFGRAGIDALAKTGTAPMRGGRPLGLVVAVAPADTPRYAIVVALPGGSGAQAAETAASILAPLLATGPAASTGMRTPSSTAWQTSGAGSNELASKVLASNAVASNAVASNAVASNAVASNAVAAKSLVASSFPPRSLAVNSSRATSSAPSTRPVSNMPPVSQLRSAPDTPASGVPVSTTLRVGRPTSSGYAIETLPIEVYVAQVVAGETSSATPPAARAALAITARTYAVVNRTRHAADGFDLCTLTHCQVTRPASAESRAAAEGTRGRLLTREGRPVPVFYSASCGGMLSDVRLLLPDVAAGAMPWLAPRPDPAGVEERTWQAEITARDLLAALQKGGLRGDTLRDLSAQVAASGLVTQVSVDGLTPSTLTTDAFRRSIGQHLGWQHLKSVRFTVARTAAGYRFTGRGHGHGVGLCVLGAAALARRGWDASRILDTYFPGLQVGADGASVDDARLTKASLNGAGSQNPMRAGATAIRVRLPEGEERHRDRLVRLVDIRLRDLSARLGVTAPAQLAVVVHPTGDSYRRATARPWWTSGATVITGADIALHLAPLAALDRAGRLEQTVRHELVHVLTVRALADRPRWVHEGLAIHFAGERVTVDPTDAPRAKPVCPTDRELLRAPDRASADRAYDRAAACVARELATGRSWRDLGTPSLSH